METLNSILLTEKKQSFLRKLVARYARGNVSLQRGAFVTANQKEKRKEAILKTNFVAN